MPEIVLMDFYTRTCSFCREEALILEELAEVFAGKIEFRMKLLERWNGFVPGEELERALKDVLS